MEDFGKEKGVGRALQEKLKQFAETQENWVSTLTVLFLKKKNIKTSSINNNKITKSNHAHAVSSILL